ncbi:MULTISPECIES: Vps62-related protein [unclassified Pseudomonas]|uniref:Vps62-related protein n=1 Tax=unclassified Pseudomonas TaxID=196821 RepID=UPI0008E4B49E|nr:MULTISPECIES: Vps62-related protein [unclassified Pseudomonas]SFI36611.1 protein of unknown function [Pseudomonas sp. NFPP04]SFJ42188.1 protein of unknown function [Pseudomonas sp. NFPP11]
MEPIQVKDLLINFTSEFTPLWNDQGSGAKKSASFWRPSTSADHLISFSSLGDVAHPSHDNLNHRKTVVVVSEANKTNGTALRQPKDFIEVWNSRGTGANADISIWQPVPPDGYVALGTVCGVGYQRPSLNTVRCVRADLAVPAYVADQIWNDKGSRGQIDFSAWDVMPPTAHPGEAYLAPGTFFGVRGYAKPEAPGLAHALHIPLTEVAGHELPAPPAPSADGQPSTLDAEESLHVCQLPWFLVSDPELPADEQPLRSPFYRLQRRDKYVLVDVARNPTTTSQTFKWTITKGSTGFAANFLKWATGVDMTEAWTGHSLRTNPKSSVRLGSAFTHSSVSSKGWTAPQTTDIAAYVPAHKTVAAYVVESEYTLLRRDASPLATSVTYTNTEQVYFSEANTTDSVEAERPQPVPAKEPPLEVTPHDVSHDPLVS